MSSTLTKVSSYLDQDREGAEVFEYVLIVAMLVALIIVLFKVIGPTFFNKINAINNGIATDGATMMGIGNSGTGTN